MTVHFTWQLSGVDASRWGLQRGSRWRPPVAVRRAVVEVPGRHGAVPSGRDPVFAAPTVSLVFQVWGDQDDLEASVNELTGLLSAPALTLTRQSGDLEASAPAQLVSISPDTFVVGRVARVTAILAIPGVFLRGPVTTDNIGVVSHGQTHEIASLAGSTAPTADAIVRVRGPLSYVAVTDEVTGTGLSWSGTLSDSQYVYVDTAGLSARRHTSASAWTSGGTNVTGGLDYPPAGPLQLWPTMTGADPADRRVRLAVEGSGFGATTSLAVRAARSYL